MTQGEIDALSDKELVAAYDASTADSDSKTTAALAAELERREHLYKDQIMSVDHH